MYRDRAIGLLERRRVVSVIEPSPAARENQRILVESEQWSVCGKFDLSIKILHENCIDSISHFSQFSGRPEIPRGALPLRTPQGETP
jgi:hypothetical protein